jgi:flagellar biosynthesis protein FlhF
MRIKTITAPKMADALSIIRQQLGPEALILGTRKVPGQNGEQTLEITAAVNEPEPASHPTAETFTPAPRRPAPATPKLADILQQHGLAPDLITKFTAALPGLESAGFNQAEALEMLLAKLIPFKPVADLLTPGQAHLFIGPPGAGKTTLIAKLAVQTKNSGRSVGMLSLDNQKIAGFEPLAITAETLGDHAHLIASPTDLRTAAQALGPRHILLIDTPGLNPYNPQAATALYQRLQGLGIPLVTHLVLPADMNAEDMAALPIATHRFNLTSLAVTRLDCTTRYGAVATTAAHAALPLGLASHNGDFATPPLSLTAQWLAQALATLPRQPWEFTS